MMGHRCFPLKLFFASPIWQPGPSRHDSERNLYYLI
jgi:hypothetical protein